MKKSKLVKVNKFIFYLYGAIMKKEVEKHWLK